MKKGYVKCPFCANEIKDGVIVCPFCEERLVEGKAKKNGKNSDNKVKMKKFLIIGIVSIVGIFLIWYLINFFSQVDDVNYYEPTYNSSYNSNGLTNNNVENNVVKDKQSKEVECASLFTQLESYEKRNEYEVVQNGWKYFLNTRVEDTFYSSSEDTCMYTTWVSEGKIRTDGQGIELQPVILSIKDSFTHKEIRTLTGTNYYDMKPVFDKRISWLK